MIIRPIEISDYQNFCTFIYTINPIVRDEILNMINTSETKAMEEMSSIILDPKRQLYVAQIDQNIVGYINVIASNIDQHNHRVRVYLNTVQSDNQQVIAYKLLKNAILWAENNNIHRIEALILKEMRFLIHIYESLGFKKEGERIESIKVNNDYMDEVSMYKILKVNNI